MATGTEWYQLKIFSRDGGGNFFQNVLHYLVAEDPAGDTFSNAKELADAFHTGVTPKIAACMSSDSAIDAVYCRKIGPPPASGNTYTRTEGVNGTIVTAVMTGVTAVNFNFFTTHPKQHGHFYLGGLPNDMFADDILAGTHTVKLNALITEFLLQLTWGAGGTANLALLSRKLNTMETVSAIEMATKSANLPRRIRPFG